jgi:hypothetical protein
VTVIDEDLLRRGERRRSWSLIGMLVVGCGCVFVLADHQVRGRLSAARAAEPAHREGTLAGALPLLTLNVPVEGDALREAAADSADAEATKGLLQPSAEGAPARPPWAALAMTLEDGSVAWPAWEIELEATAGSLGADSVGSLLAATTDPARSPSERVAAAELLRVLSRTPSCALSVGTIELEPAALAGLRLASQNAEPPVLRCAAACRALAAFGAPFDHHVLVQALVFDPSAEMRQCAAWGLQSARGDAVALGLVAAASQAPDSPGAELALIALDHLLREGAGLQDSARASVAHSIAQALLDPHSLPRARLRAVTLLGAVGPPGIDEARGALLEVLRDAKTEPTLARSAVNALGGLGDAQALRDLGELVQATELPQSHRFLAAEALARIADAAELDPAAREQSRTLLRRVAEEGATPSERKRAVIALAGFREPDDLLWIRELADPELSAFGASAQR